MSMTMDAAIELIITDFEEGFGDEHTNWLKKILEKHLSQVTTDAKTEPNADIIAQLQDLVKAQVPRQQAKVAGKRKASGWTSYAAAMKKQHGWGWKEVKENAPWSDLSDDEKAKWNRMAEDKQQLKQAKAKNTRQNPWSSFMKEFTAEKKSQDKDYKFDMKECRKAYQLAKEQKA